MVNKIRVSFQVHSNNGIFEQSEIMEIDGKVTDESVRDAICNYIELELNSSSLRCSLLKILDYRKYHG